MSVLIAAIAGAGEAVGAVIALALVTTALSVVGIVIGAAIDGFTGALSREHPAADDEPAE